MANRALRQRLLVKAIEKHGRSFVTRRLQASDSLITAYLTGRRLMTEPVAMSLVDILAENVEDPGKAPPRG